MTRQEAIWHANHVFNIVIERCINAQNLKDAREFDEAKQIVIEALEQEQNKKQERTMGIPMEDWLRGCVYHDGRNGEVTLPTDKVIEIANYIQATRTGITDGIIYLPLYEETEQ